MGQGTIPDDWTGEYCRYAVCWPNSEQWLAVLRGVLSLPARGRFWDEHTGTVTTAQQIIRETFDTNLHLKEVIMACGDEGLGEIAAALRLLAISNGSGSCCDRPGSGGQGQIAPPFDPIETGDPETEPPPEGFESWEEFFHDKCAIAWHIIETLENDLGEMIIINVSTGTLSGLGSLIAITIVTPIPFDDIIAIAAFLISLGNTIIVATCLDIINNNEEALVCELYRGNSASESFDLFIDKFSELVDSGVSDPIENFAAKTFMKYMMGSPVTNQLYTKDNTRNWTTRNCTLCEDCSELSYEFEDSSTDGFSSVETLPDCFELTLNGTAILSSADDILTVGLNSGSPNPNGAFGKTDIDYPVVDGANLQVTVRVSGAGSGYIDGVLVFDDESCSWFTFSNNHGASGDFDGISEDISSHAGKRVNELYIYLTSANAGGDGFTVEFENIFFFCV
jgi:hypothetical protein